MSEEEKNFQFLAVPDGFFTWYRNACTSGLKDVKEAETYFQYLAPEEQADRITEYKNLIESKRNSYWSGAFEG